MSGFLSSRRVGQFQASVIFLLGIGFTLGGCGMTKNLDEMHDSTSEMATTTKSMNDKMDQLTAMNNTMVTMNGNMDKMLAAMDHMATGMDSMQATMTTMATLMEQMTAMNQSMGQMKDEMATMITTLATMNTMMGVMPEMSKALTHMDSVIDELDKKMVSMDTKMDTLPKINKTMTGMSGQISGMSTQLTGLRTDLKTLKEMQGALAKMQTGVEGLGGKMDGLNTMARGIVIDAKQGVAATLRTTEMDAMNKIGTLAGKFAHASKYLLSFDYQLLKGDEVPSQADDEKLRADALTEFFMSMNGLNDTDHTIEIVTPDNRQMNILAVAAAMHVVNSNMLAALQAAKQDPNQFLSMWGMLAHALDHKAAIEKGTLTPKLWETVVLANWEEALFLIQSRENILAGVTLHNLDQLPENPKGGWTFFKQDLSILGENLSLVTGWDAKTEGASDAELDVDLQDIWMATDAEYFLISHGYDPRLYSYAGVSLKRSLSNCNIPIPSDATATRKALLEKLQTQIGIFSK